MFVIPDLTKLQQEEDTKLRDKLKEIRMAGKKTAKIEKEDIVIEADNGRRNKYCIVSVSDSGRKRK